jgi:hypothetical protein
MPAAPEGGRSTHASTSGAQDAAMRVTRHASQEAHKTTANGMEAKQGGFVQGSLHEGTLEHPAARPPDTTAHQTLFTKSLTS